MYSNSDMTCPPEERTMLLRRQLSRRALRRKPEDEYKDFAAWIQRGPGRFVASEVGFDGDFWHEVEFSDEDPHSEWE
jgi:hypothetical protein